jgi:hypothetical protein
MSDFTDIVCDGLHWHFFIETTMTPTPFTDNTGKVLTKYIRARDGTVLTLNYRRQDAHEIRAAVQRIRLKGDRTPSLSLIARRSLALYLARLQSSPAAFADEVQALEKLATPIAHRKLKPRA